MVSTQDVGAYQRNFLQTAGQGFSVGTLWLVAFTHSAQLNTLWHSSTFKHFCKCLAWGLPVNAWSQAADHKKLCKESHQKGLLFNTNILSLWCVIASTSAVL